MPLTEWDGAINAITTELAIGNALAGAIGWDVEDNLTFSKGDRLRPVGSNDTEPTAWGACVPVRQPAVATANEFAAGGYPERFAAQGIANATIDYARTKITVEAGDRATMEAHYLQFLADNGWELIEDA